MFHKVNIAGAHRVPLIVSTTAVSVCELKVHPVMLIADEGI